MNEKQKKDFLDRLIEMWGNENLPLSRPKSNHTFEIGDFVGLNLKEGYCSFVHNLVSMPNNNKNSDNSSNKICGMIVQKPNDYNFIYFVYLPSINKTVLAYDYEMEPIDIHLGSKKENE